ncbi:diacylglycerol kinase family lipid kinase [Corynebacterium sp. 3HC-13]|uniref:diacylglycerol/lipid kinase family protein n=1 Tax=Corynebacterium poyangense TaxID=2684405 RepID=UPI001CCC0C3B|nr:diacylglycerol kinase family protein [Corynebacterium poyangense]MBZ8176371.1 diacylglycerol kinase family lipid kinase [Corynebacterium poyangense]
MDVLLIANPNSTTQSDALFRQIIPRLREVPELHLCARFTHYPGHAEQMVRGLRRTDYELIIVVGGDGTLNEVINGLLGPVTDDNTSAFHPSHIPALAVIPTGSANVFARALGFPADPVAAALDLAVLIEGDFRRTICLGTWNHRWFAVNAGFGIDADVIARIERARAKGFSASPLRYLAVSLRTWFDAQRCPPAISAWARDRQGGELELHQVPLCLASNTNPWTFLGPLPVVTNPRNSFDRGLSMFVLRDLRGIKGVLAMVHLIGIGHRRWLEELIRDHTIQFDDIVELELRCEGPQRFQADGEFEGEWDYIRLATVPDAIEVMAPQYIPESTSRSWRVWLKNTLRLLRN